MRRQLTIKDKDIAASIIYHIRRAAPGEVMIPFEQRVQAGLAKILSQQSWTHQQRQWLTRLGKQLTHEMMIIDREIINQLPTLEGGANNLKKS